MSFAAMERGNYVSFNLYPNSVLSNTYTNVKIMSIPDSDDVKGLIDPIAVHANLLPILPNGTPKDAADFPYYKIRLPNGTITAIGKAWIQESSIVLQTTASFRYTFENMTPARKTALDALLSANDYSAINVEAVD